MQILWLESLQVSRLARALLLSAILLFLADSFSANAQSPDAVADLAARINRERVARGLAPYALNAQLTAAAQAHVNDIASTGRYSHTGSDGSTVFDRVARTGYGAYSWGRRLGENWAWYHTAAAAMNMWMQSAPHRANILHTAYREFGIGIAPSQQGGFVYVVDFGAQPNVLPIFIENGAASTTSTNVTITLSNEEAAPSGDGAKTIGRATEVQISGGANFPGAQWQPFAPRFAWTLPGDGTKTIYVRYRDARSRIVTSSDSILWNAPAAALSSLTPSPEPTLLPTQTLTSPPTQRPTSLPTQRPTPLPTQTLTPLPAQTPTALPTQRSRSLAPTTTRVLPTPNVAQADAIGAIIVISPMDVGSEQNEMVAQRTEEPTLVEPTPPESPTPAIMSLESRSQDNVVPIALGVFGVVVMLYVVAVVQYLNRLNNFSN